MKSGYWIAAAAASLLMTSRPQPRNQLQLPSFHGIAEVRASIPGRIRLYMPAVTTNPEAAELMKKQFGRVFSFDEAINMRGVIFII